MIISHPVGYSQCGLNCHIALEVQALKVAHFLSMALVVFSRIRLSRWAKSICRILKRRGADKLLISSPLRNREHGLIAYMSLADLCYVSWVSEGFVGWSFWFVGAITGLPGMFLGGRTLGQYISRLSWFELAHRAHTGCVGAFFGHGPAGFLGFDNYAQAKCDGVARAE